MSMNTVGDAVADILVQTAREQALLKQCRVTLEDAFERDNHQFAHPAQKLIEIRAAAQELYHHLERVWEGEESQRGFMQVVTEAYPESAEHLVAFREQHQRYRREMSLLTARLQFVAASNANEIAAIGRDLQKLMDEIDRHHLQESRFLQVVFRDDAGGEG